MRRVGVAAMIVVSGLGCRYDREDLYRGVQSDTGPDGGVALTSYEAALRVYGDEAACVACVERECTDEARACADDAPCAADATCRAGCAGDPFCQGSCADRHPLADRPTHPLERCLAVGCVSECRVGENFDCAGEYGLPEPQTDAPIVLTMQLMTGLPPAPLLAAGIRARVCSWPDVECGEPVGPDAHSDEMGLVAVEFPPAVRVAGRAEPFAAYIEISDPDRDPPRILPLLFVPVSGPPPQGPRSSNANPWAVTPVRASDQPLLETITGTLTPGTGFLLGVGWDCRGSEIVRGTGITIEVSPSDDDTRVFYSLAPANLATRENGAFQVTNVLPGIATITAFHAGAEYARIDVPVRADAGTFFFLQVPGR